MYTKAKKTISHVTPGETSLPGGKKQARVMQFLAQKREQFTLTILNGLCSNPKTLEERVVVSSRGGQHTEISNAEKVVNLAVDMADKLLEKLYPIKEEEGSK